jgi:hypothetical protein
MPLTTAGRNFIANAICNNASPVFYDASNAHLGVGDSNTAFNASQTNLQAVTNKHREPVDGAPGVSTNVITLVATFESADANFAWEEWGVFNHVSAGTMLTRKVESLGTKTSAAEWELTVALTVAIGS